MIVGCNDTDLVCSLLRYRDPDICNCCARWICDGSINLGSINLCKGEDGEEHQKRQKCISRQRFHFINLRVEMWRFLTAATRISAESDCYANLCRFNSRQW